MNTLTDDILLEFHYLYLNTYFLDLYKQHSKLENMSVLEQFINGINPDNLNSFLMVTDKMTWERDKTMVSDAIGFALCVKANQIRYLNREERINLLKSVFESSNHIYDEFRIKIKECVGELDL